MVATTLVLLFKLATITLLVAFSVLVVIFVLAIKELSCVNPLILSVAPNILAFETRLATVACPVDCTLVATILVLLFNDATIAAPVLFKVAVVISVLLIMLPACNKPLIFKVDAAMAALLTNSATVTVLAALSPCVIPTQPFTSSVLRGVYVPIPTLPCMIAPCDGAPYTPAYANPNAIPPPTSRVFCGIVIPPIPVPFLVTDMFLDAAPTALI